MTDASERFHALFEAHYDAIHRYCLRRLPVDVAGDAACEVFVTAWRRIDDVPEGDRALNWLYGVAGNVVRNARRTAWRTSRLRLRLRGTRDVAVYTEDRIVQSSETEATLAALDRLAPADREIILLRTYEDLWIPDIADAVGCAEAAARKRLARAIARLRNELERQPVPAHSRASKGGIG